MVRSVAWRKGQRSDELEWRRTPTQRLRRSTPSFLRRFSRLKSIDQRKCSVHEPFGSRPAHVILNRFLCRFQVGAGGVAKGFDRFALLALVRQRSSFRRQARFVFVVRNSQMLQNQFELLLDSTKPSRVQWRTFRLVWEREHLRPRVHSDSSNRSLEWANACQADIRLLSFSIRECQRGRQSGGGMTQAHRGNARPPLPPNS
jgi:hypothetical protein